MEFINGVAVDTGRVGLEVTPTFNQATGEYTGMHAHSNFPLEGDNQLEPLEYEMTADDPGFVDQQYVGSLFEAYPDLSDAISWAADGWPEDMVERFNAAVDADDLDTMVPMIEMLLEQYQHSEYQEVSEEEETFELTQEVVNEEYDHLMTVEPEGYDTAAELMDEADAQSDPIAASILEAAAFFHNGEMSADEAIQSVLSEYNINDVAPIYAEMMNL